jgi:hypothetical protein
MLWLEFFAKLLANSSERRHELSKISHTEPSHHCDITHWAYMEEWFSTAMVGVVAANNLGFGCALVDKICQTFGAQCHRDMRCPKSATQSPLNIVTSLRSPIWRK